VTDRPGEHPEPPNDIADRSPLLYKLEPGIIFSRIHPRDKGPVFFGRTGGNRFDSPSASFGVLYVGMDESCAFAETFLQDTGVRLVSRQSLEQRQLTYLELTIGANSRLFSGSHTIAQRWSAALHDHKSGPAGILYPARHDSARHACALYDLPASAFRLKEAGSFLEPKNMTLLAGILDRYDIGLVD
jgi:RES domain